MVETVEKLSTIDLLMRKVYFRSIDDVTAVTELRARHWPLWAQRGFVLALFPFIAVERVLAWLDLDAWDLPTAWGVRRLP